MIKNFVAGILVLVFTQMSIAQFSESAVTDCYYFQNAYVVQKPGIVLPSTNVIIRKGMITDVGPNLKVPFDAKIIHVDSMYIYAGFIDGYSNAGIKKEEKKEDGNGRGRGERMKIQGDPSYEQSGVTPQKSALDVFKSNEGSVTDLRKAGFTISHVVPEGRLLPGQGSLFLLTDVGSADRLSLRTDFSLGAQLVGAMSPTTLIGGMAKYRDVFKNTEYGMKNLQTYQLNPTGINRPEISEELLALMPAVKKEKSLFFIGQKTKDIHRILTLNKEFNYNIVLTGLKDGSHMIPMIKSANVPVLLSLDLPEEVKDPNKKKEVKVEEKETKKGDVEEKDKDGAKDKKAKEENKEILSAEMMHLETRKYEAYQDYVAQAAKMEQAGVSFGFTSLDVKSRDIQGNIRKMISAGLSEKTALTALTTYPAQLLGISKITGTVESGKMANLVITDKSYFEDKAQIKYMVVEGKVFDYTEPPKKTNKNSDQSGEKMGLNGEWAYTVEVPGDAQRGTLIFSNAPESTMIELKSADEPVVYKATDVIISGSKVKTTITVDINGQMVPVSFDLEFDGDTFSGTVSLPEMGSFPITGNRSTGPKY